MAAIAEAGALNFTVAAAVAVAAAAAAAVAAAVATAVAAVKMEPTQSGNQKCFISLLPKVTIEAINA